MATLVLTALGTAIGGPIGGTIGAFIGQQVDTMVFAGGTRQGPRLRELTVSTSSYGQPIPRNFGRMRVPGTIIWSTDLIESKRKDNGRKGQPSTVAHSYSASFAVALSSTPIVQIGRIWADGNLLRGEQGDLKVGGTLRFHSGHGDGEVDPAIAADKQGQAPAFRGLAYVVFENLDLGAYGNRIPALSFEIFGDGDEDAVSLGQLVPQLTGARARDRVSQAHGIADEGGPVASVLSGIDQVIPLICTSGPAGLEIAVRAAPLEPVATLPPCLAADADGRTEGLGKQRAGTPPRAPAALRYYDQDRDYQPGVQRAAGERNAGREAMIDLPATLTADGARQLASDCAHRARWQHESLRWRIGELDPRIGPGSVVRLPDLPGNWLVRSWEWFERGIELDLERLAPSLTVAGPSDAGGTLPPVDLPIPPTLLHAFEVPAGDAANPATPHIFAAASAANASWRGAALYALQGDALVDIGTTGSQRATIGVLAEPLPAASSAFFAASAAVLVDLAAEDGAFTDTDMPGLAAGANRLLIGSEVIQFARATPLGNRRWRLSGLLRGRGGTEPEAAAGHPAGAAAILLDDTLVALDPVEVPPIAGSRIAAIGLRDDEPVFAPLVNAGLSRRPLMPVHPRRYIADNRTTFTWVRRARGQYRWEDAVDVPLMEERERYLVGYGPVAAPYRGWECDAPSFILDASELADLGARYGPAPLWVQQVGTFARSPALLLATLP